MSKSTRTRSDSKQRGSRGRASWEPEASCLPFAANIEDEEKAAYLLHCIRPGCLFLDTETTGLTALAEIIEIGVVDYYGETVFHSYVKPSPTAAWDTGKKVENIHREILPHLTDAPSWPTVEAALCAAIRHPETGRDRQMFNWEHGGGEFTTFDRRLISQTREAQLMPPLDIAQFRIENIKPLILGLAPEAWKSWGSVKGEGGVGKALRVLGLEFDGQAHTALVDARAEALIVRTLQRQMIANGFY